MFGELLRAHRHRSGLTQEELAAASAVSVRNIRDLEAGRIARPRPATVRRLAGALGLTGDERARFVSLAVAAEPPPPARPRPAQLPAGPPVFVGRDDEVALLDAADDTAAVWTVTGPAGVGKTSFAVHWAHRVAGDFPDGQLYVDLRGFGPGDIVAPQEAVRGFLDAFGLPPAAVPDDLSAQVSLYRSVLAG